MKEAMFEILYVGMFFSGFAIAARHSNIKKNQRQRSSNRKKELIRHEQDEQYKIVHKLWELEKTKANRQSITIKGVFAEKIIQGQMI